MRYLLTLFMVLMTLQPVGLQACAMHGEKQISQHASMQHQNDTQCCSPESSTPSHDCGQAAHCSAVAPVAPVIPATSAAVFVPTTHSCPLAAEDRYTGPPKEPLFRPPIA